VFNSISRGIRESHGLFKLSDKLKWINREIDELMNLKPGLEPYRDFLLSVRGLGLKSVECIRLLSLHHPSFPVRSWLDQIFATKFRILVFWCLL
jgi:endonuclease III-like uncharacterized protein